MIVTFLPLLLQDDDDGHLTALQIVEDLMQKSPDTFLDHFARLGVFNMVHSLAGPPPEDEDEEDGDDARINDKKVSRCVVLVNPSHSLRVSGIQ